MPAADPLDLENVGGFWTRTLASLRSRNFRLFFIGQTISNTGNWLTMVALTLLVLHRTNSGVAVGAVAACQFGPILLVSAWAGAVVDRSNKKRLLLFTQVGEMLQSFALAALAFAHNAPLAAFFGVAIVGGCLLAVDNPVRRSFVNEMVPQKDVANAVTVYSAMVNISRIGGPALAGVLIVTVGYGWAFTVDAFSYVAVLIALAMMRPAELRVTEATARAQGQVRAGVRYILSVPELWITFAVSLAVGLGSYNFTVTLPLLVERGLHGSDSAYTIVYSAFSVGALLGAFVVARREDVGVAAVLRSSAALGGSLLLIAVVPSVALAIVVSLLVGGAGVAFMTAVTSVVQLRTKPSMLGRVLALQTVVLIGTTPVGGPLAGALADATNARVPMVVGAACAIAAASFGALAARRARA
ncbi:MAG TPA: MFS transporter [Acidimicrobiales bacterium]|nr:MFS transporter [Acidimicrobiales bacterium]